MGETGRKAPVYLRSSARTNVGQVRKNNEDSVHLWGDPEHISVVAVVADGMGGAAAGEEASRLAVEAVQQALTPDDVLPDDRIGQRLRETIRTANANIMERAAGNPEFRGMGTTVTLAYVHNHHAVFAHVGDSRAYRIDGLTNEITQITADHSFVEALVAAGHLTAEQAEDHPMKNVLYRALGQHEEVDIDVYEAHVRVGDRLLLCSDGLTRHVKPSEIARIVLSNPNPDDASEVLINLTNARGGEDNVSVIIIAVESRPRPLELNDDSTVELRAVQPNARATEEDTARGIELPDEPTIPVRRPYPDTPADTTEEILPAHPVTPSIVDGEGRDTLAPEQ